MNHNPKLRIHEIKFLMVVWGRLTHTYTYPYLIDRVNMDIEERMLVLCLMIDPQINTSSR